MKKLLSILLLASALTGTAQLRYDTVPPQMHMPILEREASPNYDVNNKDTYPIYRATHLVTAENNNSIYTREYAIWCTTEATYLAERSFCSMPYMTYHPTPSAYIQDCATGIKYRQTDELGYPRDKGCYLVHGLYGTFIVNIEVYPPLPATCQEITFGGEALDDPRFPQTTKAWIRGEKVRIADLQKNQGLMLYNPPLIVE